MGIDGGLRWHPSGEALVAISGGNIFSVSLRDEDFGAVRFLTEGGDYAKLAVTPDGNMLFFCGPDPRGESDPAWRNYAGKPYWQLFSVPFAAP